MTPVVAVAHVTSWFDPPHVRFLNPSQRHLVIPKGLLDSVGVGGTLVTDAHLEAS